MSYRSSPGPPSQVAALDRPKVLSARAAVDSRANFFFFGAEQTWQRPPPTRLLPEAFRTLLHPTPPLLFPSAGPRRFPRSIHIPMLRASLLHTTLYSTHAQRDPLIPYHRRPVLLLPATV